MVFFKKKGGSSANRLEKLPIFEERGTARERERESEEASTRAPSGIWPGRNLGGRILIKPRGHSSRRSRFFARGPSPPPPRPLPLGLEQGPGRVRVVVHLCRNKRSGRRSFRRRRGPGRDGGTQKGRAAVIWRPRARDKLEPEKRKREKRTREGKMGNSRK